MKLKKINKSIQEFQDLLTNNKECFGDGKSIATTPEVPITHNFADQLYIRQMDLKKDHVIVGAIHNHLHVWFLMKGRVLINNNGDQVEHVAPCYTISEPGSKRLIYAIEDSIFVNVHKNPTNTKDIKKLEKDIVSFTVEEYNNKTQTI